MVRASFVVAAGLITLCGCRSDNKAGRAQEQTPNVFPQPSAATSTETSAGVSGKGGPATTVVAGVSGAGALATETRPNASAGSGGVTPVPAAGSGGSAGAAVSVAGAGGGAGAVQALPSEITTVDVTQNIKRRFGAPHVAVNPKDPNNIIVLASSNLGYTRDCLPPAPGSDCEMVPAGGNFLLNQPRGFARTAGFMDIGVFVSFDRGKTFKYVDVSALTPPDHPEVRSRGEGPLAALPDGSFLIGFNAINWGNWESEPMTFFPNGGVGVIKSTDGGPTWRWTSYSYTPADWPFGGADPVSGTFYVTSGLVGLSTLGPRSNGIPNSPEGDIADRWISSTQDGVTWTDPQPLGAANGTSHVGAGHSPAAAAHGTVATLFLASDQSACSLFTGSAAATCVVFQTSTDAGATWSRHRVPTPLGFSPAALSVFVGADPVRKDHFTVALLNESGADFLIFHTKDAGATWSEPVRVTEDASKTHFSPYAGYSPKGEFGLMWRTYEREGASAGAAPPTMPYSVWAVVSKEDGITISQPLKVSQANSPAPPSDPDDAFAFVGDHGPSGIALDDAGGVYVVWADWTPGERAIFFSAISSTAFTF
jgi:hypothetical protein